MEGDPLQAKDAVSPSAVSSYGALAEKSQQGNQPRSCQGHARAAYIQTQAIKRKPTQEQGGSNRVGL